MINIGSEHLELIDKFFRHKKGVTTGRIVTYLAEYCYLYYGNTLSKALGLVKTVCNLIAFLHVQCMQVCLKIFNCKHCTF